MKYFMVTLFLLLSTICQAKLVPLTDQSLAAIRGQADISAETKQQNKINAEVTKISQIALFSQIGHNLNPLQKHSIDNLEQDSLQNLSIQLTLSSIPIFGWLFMLSEMEDITISP